MFIARKGDTTTLGAQPRQPSPLNPLNPLNLLNLRAKGASLNPHAAGVSRTPFTLCLSS